MTSTLDVVKEVLSSKWAYEILKALNESDLSFTNLKKAIHAQHSAQVSRTISELDKLALVDHVFTKSGNFYRISARGKKILSIIKAIENESPLELHVS